MKVKIDSKKISSSANLLNEEIKSNEEIKEIIDQLKQQLLYGNNSCFLISGYRGTGKTTLVKRLENQIEDNNMIFIHLNFTKYESYSLVLRKLIREIYLTLSASKNYKLIKEKNKDLIDNIEVLYDHTFYEVFSSSNIKNLKEFSSKLESNLALKDLLPIIVVILSSLNISLNIIPEFAKNSNVIIQMLSIGWFIYESIKIKVEFKRKRTSVEELNRKSLYDDEIAEYHLKNILEGLNKEEIKVIFVFDELDKIENEVEMQNIISDLKPLLLSNLASFIVISGQKLYYKFLSSSILDDSIMTSIFSKNIHVPLTTNISLEKSFNYYIIDKEDTEKNLVIKYRDSLILNSYRTVRRFINLILQNIIWEDKSAYLFIDEEDIEQYDTDSIILSVLTKIIESDIDDCEYDSGVKDFLAYQLFIWVKKMKLKGKVYFINNEIFNYEDDYSEIYPFWCRAQLNDLYNRLVNGLLNKNLLEKKTDNNDEQEVIYYKWTSDANIKIEGVGDELAQIKSKFMENMIELEKYCRDICLDLNKNYKENRRALGLISSIRELIDIGVINDEWMSKERRELYTLNNKIRHGEILQDKEINILQQHINDVKMLIVNLIEGYCYYVIGKYLKGYGYNVKDYNIKNSRFDIIAENSNINEGDIVFEIKYRNIYSNNDKNMIYRLIQQLKEYNFRTQKRNKLVLFWFSKESRKSFEKFKSEFFKIIINEFNDLGRDIYLFYASEHRTNFNTIRMQVYLDRVIKPMQNMKNNSEIAATINDNI